MQKHKLTITLNELDYAFLTQKAAEKDMVIKELAEGIIHAYILASKNYPKVEMFAKGLFCKIKEALKPKQVQEAV